MAMAYSDTTQHSSWRGTRFALAKFRPPALPSTLITAAHLRMRSETGASLPTLVLAIVAAGAVLMAVMLTALVHEPASIVTLLAILVLTSAWTTGGSGTAPAVRCMSRSVTKSLRS